MVFYFSKMLTNEEVQQLKNMYEKEFGEKISDGQVIEYAQSLLDLITAVYKNGNSMEGLNEKTQYK